MWQNHHIILILIQTYITALSSIYTRSIWKNYKKIWKNNESMKTKTQTIYAHEKRRKKNYKKFTLCRFSMSVKIMHVETRVQKMWKYKVWKWLINWKSSHFLNWNLSLITSRNQRLKKASIHTNVKLSSSSSR